MSEPLELTLINGERAQQVAASERALQYGDGLFETIGCRDGRARRLALHWQRLQAGCERLGVRFDALSVLEQEVTRLADWRPRCLVKVILSRGPAMQRGYRPSGTERPTRIVSRHAWPPEADPDRPLRVGLSSVRLGTNPLLAGLKHLNRLEQVLAQQARPERLDEVLMLSSSGLVISGSMSNVFFATAQELFTPALHECGVAGVMRRAVLEIADGSRTDGLAPITIRAVEPAELAEVREAFLTNVRWGVRSIGELDGRPLSSDDWARRIRARLDAAEADEGAIDR